ncbi:MAG: CPXCG motif-containing cysteine-rich protein [Candidatus Melainabacteria bacterium]
MDSVFTCAYCFESNSIFVDPDGGGTQQYVEDCQVCCRPNTLSIGWDDEREMFVAESQPAQ